jgi:hypothetical protein
LVVVAGWKRREKIFRFLVFNLQDPQDPCAPRALRAKLSSIPLLGGLTPKFLSVGTRILIFFALDPKLVPKTGNLRIGNSKIRKTG